MTEKEAKENKKIIVDNYKFRLDPMAKLYDDLYNKTEYGKDGAALKNFHFFERWIEPPFADVGCGRGNIVKRARDKGIQAHGYDIISGRFMFQSAEALSRYGALFSYETDITKHLDLSKYKTAICIDVLEHIPEKAIPQVLKNLATAEKQVISVATIPDKSTDGILHVTVKPFTWWDSIISEHMDIIDTLDVEEWHRFYFTRRK